MCRQLRPLAIALALCLLAPAGRADEFHYNDVFMGPRAAGLGGTMIGLADEASAAYYNPAGLAHTSHETILLTATAVFGKSLTFAGAYENDITFSSATAFSPAAISTVSLGSGNLAFMALTPTQDAFRVDTALEAEQLSAGRFSREQTDSSYLVGFAYGQEIGRDIDLGVGVGYLYRSYSEHRSFFVEANAQGAGEWIAFEQSHDEKGLHHGLMLLAGLLWHPLGHDGPLRVGLSLRSGINVATSASLRTTMFLGRRAEGQDAVTYERLASPEEQRNGTSRTPPMLGLGVAWRPLPFWTLAADVTLHGFIEYESFESTVTKLATLNGSLGSEFRVGEGISLRLGAFTNRSSAKRGEEGDLLGVGLDRWDQYGGTLGASFQRLNYELSLAFKYARMVGDIAMPEGLETTSLSDVSGRELGFVFGGSYQF